MRLVKWIAVGVLGIMAAMPAMAQKPKTPKELEALQKLFNAQDPDTRIKEAQNVITKFADTEFKAICMQMIAQSYQQKGDAENSVVWSEKLLEADPKSYTAMLTIAGALAQKTREFDLDKDEKLGRAEKLAKDAQAIIPNAPKMNPAITDEQWNGFKKDQNAEALQILGMIASVRKKPEDAVKYFKESVETAASPDPATMVRLAAAYNSAGKPDDALALIAKMSSQADMHPAIKQFADSEKKRAEQLKAAKK